MQQTSGRGWKNYLELLRTNDANNKSNSKRSNGIRLLFMQKINQTVKKRRNKTTIYVNEDLEETNSYSHITLLIMWAQFPSWFPILFFNCLCSISCITSLHSSPTLPFSLLVYCTPRTTWQLLNQILMWADHLSLGSIKSQVMKHGGEMTNEKPQFSTLKWRWIFKGGGIRIVGKETKITTDWKRQHLRL